MTKQRVNKQSNKKKVSSSARQRATRMAKQETTPDAPMLYVCLEHDLFRLKWIFPDDDALGGILGETDPQEIDDDVERQVEHARQTAASLSPGATKDTHGFGWEGESQASAALAVVESCQTAVEAQAHWAWPDWALQAKAEGWTPPKHWKPT